MRSHTAAAALLALARIGSGQEPVRFEASQHLEGFEAAARSEWCALYPLEEYSVHEGQDLSASELDVLQGLWRADLERVKLRIAALVADPGWLEQRITEHPYFSKISCARITRPPFLFLVQEKTPGEDPARAQELADRYAAILEPTLVTFETRFVAPYGLRPRPADARFVVAILASSNEFERCIVTANLSWHFEVRSLHDRDLGAAIVEDSPTSAHGRWDLVRSARHAFAHVLAQAWSQENALPILAWPFEGLADYLARRSEELPGAEHPDRSVLRDALAAACDPDLRPTHWRTIEELTRVFEPARLTSFLSQQTGGRAPEGQALGLIWNAFHRQSALFFFFLQEAEAGRYRGALGAFLKQSLAGEGDVLALAEALDPLGLDELERSFRAWLVAEHRQAWPDEPLDTKAFLEHAVEARPAPTPSRPVPLDLADVTCEERFALALDRLRSGRTREGSARIEALLGESLDPGLRSRIEREHARVAAWVAARDAYFRFLAEQGGSLEFVIDGRSFESRVRGLEEDVLLLEPGRAVERLSLEGLDPLQLARQMPAAVDGSTPRWVRIYPYVLGGDGRWKSLLKDEDSDARALLADAREDYPARLRLADALERLESIVAAPGPESLLQAQERLDEIGSFREEFGALALFERKRQALRDRAASLHRTKLDMEGTWTLLRGKFEALAGGLVRIRYDFDDPAELEDFAPYHYAERLRKPFPPVPDADAPFSVDAGVLTIIGKSTLRSLFDLASPLSVRYGLEIVRGANREDPFYLGVGVCDNGTNHFVWACNLDELRLFDLRDSESALANIDRIYFDAPYAMEIRHDGERVELSCDGERMASLGCGSRKAGAIFLWAHSALKMRIDRLEIDGHAHPGSFDRLREAWIARQLESF